MLRRNSARNQQRRPLSRSKSTNSIPRSPVRLLDIIDPAVAERDAHIAALISYHKSQNRELQRVPPEFQDQPRAMEKNGATSGLRNQGLERHGSARDRQSHQEGASGIRRQKSVRFVGPDARPRRSLASRAIEIPTGSRATPSDLHALGNVDNRPSSTLSYSRKTTDPHGITKRYIESLQTPGEMYTPEDDVASMPSSYRRLRKSKSMFSALNAPNTGYHCHNSIPENRKRGNPGNAAVIHKKENDRLMADHPPRPSTSLSILKGRRSTAAPHLASRAENDLAIHLAREQFRDQVQSQKLSKTRPSIFFGSKNKRSESALGFRKSLRSSSNNSTALSSTFSSHSLSLPKQPGLRTTARKVSKTLRTKLKGLFTRPKNAPESEVQDAQHDIHGSEGGSCVFHEEYPPTEASVLRVPSHVPSLHAVSSNQELRSRRGSVESVGSVGKQTSDDKSRVTSWTDSITNTASSAEDGELQRLSMIRESAPHTSSVALAHKPNLNQSQGSSSVPIDNQQVCSALVRRMKEIKRRDEELNHVVGSIKAQGNVPMNTLSDGGWNESTIRCVRAEDDVFRSQNKTTVVETRNPPERVTNRQSSSRESLNGGRNDTPTRTSFEARSNGNVSATITHRSSAFFAGPTCHLFRTASPYRRALRDSMKLSEEQETNDTIGSRYLRSLSEISLPIRRPSNSESEKDARVTCSESIYSCRTEDIEQPASEAMIPPKSKSHEQIVAQKSGNTSIPTHDFARKLSLQHQRDVSTASSVEWKTWLSANVSKLEELDTPQRVGRGEEQHRSLPVRGHVREQAEIDSPREVIKLLGTEPDGFPNQNPLGSVQGNARSNSIVMPSYADISKMTATWDENEVPWVVPPTDLKEDLPVLPPRNQLRPCSSLAKSHSESWMNRSASPTEKVRERPFNTVSGTNFSPSETRMKRRAYQVASPAKSSPGLTSTIERRFSNTASGSPAQKTGNSTSQSTPRSRKRVGIRDESGKGNWVKDSDLNPNTPAMGSKRMVDMFLDSRRKRTLGDIIGTEMGSSPTVFL